MAAENCFSDFYNEVSCFTLALSYFGRKTWDLKNTSAEFEIKGKKNRAFSIKIPDSVFLLFFLGSASDKYQRQNEAYDKQE